MAFKSILAAGLALTSVAVVPAANAQRYGGGYGYDGGYGAPRYEQPYRGYGYGGGYDRGGYDRDYDRSYRGGDGYHPCRGGTTGAILGALAGGLLGRAIDDRGDHAVGTIVGAGAGALAGRAVERSGQPGYCRR